MLGISPFQHLSDEVPLVLDAERLLARLGLGETLGVYFVEVSPNLVPYDAEGIKRILPADLLIRGSHHFGTVSSRRLPHWPFSFDPR